MVLLILTNTQNSKKMKKINKNTILKQGEKTYQPVEVDGVIYWVDEEVVCKTGELYLTSIQRRILPKSKGVIQAGDKIVAQSEPKLEGIPVISLDNYVERLAEKEWKNVNRTGVLGYIDGYKSNPNQYSKKDIEKFWELTKKEIKQVIDEVHIIGYTKEQILEQINSISVIEVDEFFNIISYE